MKNLSKMAGVTLLEVMLVLAVAAMIIVMSVRYYQSATNSSQVNDTMQLIQGITAAEDGLAQNTGSYSSGDTTAIQPLMPNGQMTTDWGGTVSVAGTATTFTITFSPAPSPVVCTMLTGKMLQGGTGSKYTLPVGCGSVTYTSTN
jgi:Tfp pilus assembly protein PilE